MNGTYSYTGNSYWSGQAISVEEETATRTTTRTAEAILKVNSIYNDRIPFFTKDTLQDIFRQLKKSSKKGEKVSVKSLNGAMVDFELETGLIREANEPELEFIVHTPYIDYLSIPVLTSYPNNLDPHLVYCNLQISHWMSQRNKITKEVLYTFPVQPRVEVEKFLRFSLEAWEASEPCKQLRSTLVSKNIPFEVTKVVGLACGTIAPGDKDPLAHRSSFQHALILTMQDILDKQAKKPGQIKCFAQDPIYTDIDKSVLEGSGITILDDPGAFLEVDDSTVVISSAPDVPVKHIISDIAQPAMMIWDRIKDDKKEDGQEKNSAGDTDPDTPRLREMIRNFYDELEFPNDREHFADLAIYVRRVGFPSS